MNTLKNLSKILALMLLIVFTNTNANSQCTNFVNTPSTSTTIPPGTYTGTIDLYSYFSSNYQVFDIYGAVTFSNATVLATTDINGNLTKIVVHSGGSLTIQNSTFSSKCAGWKWGGIEVQGNPTLPYSTSNGFVDVQNSQISDAEVAVNLVDNGGAQINTSSFTDNNIGVKIVGNGNSSSYPWSFSENDFDWGDLDTDTTDTTAHIFLSVVDGVSIYGCNFSNSSPSTVNVPFNGSLDFIQRGIGIRHDRSEFLVSNSGLQGACGDVIGGRKSTFRDLGFGIYMGDIPPSPIPPGYLTNQMVVVEYSKFTNNFWGVFSQGERIYDIQYNRFEFTDGTDFFSVGAVNVWSGHVGLGHNNNPSHTNIINNNTFQTYQNGNFSVGVAGEWSSFDYHVRKNIFIYGGDILNSWGVRFDFMNPTPAVSKITCNKFVGTDIDIALYNCTGNLSIGNGSDLANNIFSYKNVSIDVIGNNPNPTIDYVRSSSSLAPINSPNVVDLVSSTIMKCRLCEIQPSIAPEEGKGDKAQPGKIGIAGSNAQSTTPSWKEYPTPGTGNYTLLSVDNHLQGNVTLKVFDIAGKEILNTTADGAKEILVDISAQPSGIYIYHITQNGQTYFTGKLIKE